MVQISIVKDFVLNVVALSREKTTLSASFSNCTAQGLPPTPLTRRAGTCSKRIRALLKGGVDI